MLKLSVAAAEAEILLLVLRLDRLAAQAAAVAALAPRVQHFLGDLVLQVKEMQAVQVSVRDMVVEAEAQAQRELRIRLERAGLPAMVYL
jgi:hypothetical protein